MPIPSPQNESRDEFIARCMADRTMVGEFADAKQRAAVCYDKWKEANESRRESS